MIQSNAHILIEDNSNILNDNIKKKINKESFYTHYFQSSYELLNILKYNDIDLVILHSVKTLKDIRQHYSKNELPIIIISHDIDNIIFDIYEDTNDFINAKVIEYDIIPKIYLSISRCQKIKNLIELTNKDYLTGVYNKRYFYEEAKKHYERCDNIALCMIDLDNFKMINDTYGHIVGDYAIKEVANILKKNTKGKDIVARFGGDEFCVLLRDINEKDAVKLMESIQQNIKNKIFHLINTKIQLSISVGVTTDKGNSFEQMINIPDQKLLESKKLKPKIKIETNQEKYETLEVV
jgi:diguanylate cyclase (GGDEF)-like protein